jgi:hypothetical protein
LSQDNAERLDLGCLVRAGDRSWTRGVPVGSSVILAPAEETHGGGVILCHLRLETGTFRAIAPL